MLASKRPVGMVTSAWATQRDVPDREASVAAVGGATETARPAEGAMSSGQRRQRGGDEQEVTKQCADRRDSATIVSFFSGCTRSVRGRSTVLASLLEVVSILRLNCNSISL